MSPEVRAARAAMFAKRNVVNKIATAMAMAAMARCNWPPEAWCG